MRHGRHVKKLGVKTPHRRAMLSNMAASLISTGKIKTTTSRAKELQGRVEKLVTLGKKGSIHARRQALSVLRDRNLVKKLFDEVAPEFQGINGGYTKRAFLGRRLGDGASLSVVELNIAKKVTTEAEVGKKAKLAKKSEKADKKGSEKKKTKKKTKSAGKPAKEE